MTNKRSYLLFFLLFSSISFPPSSSSPPFNSTHRCSIEQTHALLMFKQNLNVETLETNRFDSFCHESLGSRYHPVMMNWKKSIDCCMWDGVTCNRLTGDVIALDLSCGMLRGTIHPNTTLFHLPHLQKLNLAYNDFTGQLPHEIARFSNSLTHLNIAKCGFIGQVPSEISFLSKLVSLDLSWNEHLSLDPHVFNNLLQNSSVLEELLLGNVYISSTLPIHLNISTLKILDLSSTGMNGKFPDNIFKLPYLQELYLSDNEFTSEKPLEISSCSKLASIFLSRNRFPLQIHSDVLKSLLQNSTYLRSLGLGGVDIGLVLSPHLNITSSLESLNLSSTGLLGNLPDSIFNLPYLVSLDLSDNSGITGVWPNINMSTNSGLEWLSLSSTNLSPGEIPHSIGHLKSLKLLYLSSCNLRGSLPKSLANLRHVIYLDLSYNMLNGTLPSWVFTLPSLEYIWLQENMFGGNLPLELFTLQSLKQISLHNNQLDGRIDVLDQHPDTLQTFRQLINLISLDLSFNNFKGVWELDTLLSILPNLDELHLSYSGLSVTTNNASGYVMDFDMRWLGLASCKLTVVPEYLRGMKDLQFLDLSNNEIQGHIPDWAREIGGNRLLYLNLSHNSITSFPQFEWHGLRFLHLGNNNFHGTIPNVYQDCGQLEGLVLNGNQFEGEVPSSLSKCRFLKVLDLGNNHFNGTFPSWLENLPNLQVLDLKSNNFHGPILAFSQVKLPFPSLKVLDLSNNRFVGHLPQIYFQNFNAMKEAVRKGPRPQYLNTSGWYYSINIVLKGVEQNFQHIFVDYIIVDLSNNSFEGEIPNVIGDLNSLKVLNLSHNHLTGRIPHALGNLTEIESLDLSFNQLTGEIPQILADNLPFLALFNLSQNHLMGLIPLGKQFNTFEASSYGGNQELCGIPLSKMCENSHETQPEAGQVERESGFTWRVVVLGYGCGILLGLVMGYYMLSSGKPKWFSAIVDLGEDMIHTRLNKRR